MVAAHAGVSPMSVSNVLNGRAASARTRERVHAAIDELGYVPNRAARQLASADPMFIGLVHANDEHPISAALLTGALTAASRLGVQLLLQPIIFPEIESGWAVVQALRARGAEAILLPPVFGEDMANGLAPGSLDFPMLCVGAADAMPNVSTVRMDEFTAAREVTARLIVKGHRRIGFIRVPERFPIHHTRGGGYLAALEEHGIAVDPDLIVEGEFWFQEGLNAAARLLGLSDPPTAIFASNDEMAMGVLAAAHMRGIAVPEALAIVGFEDNYFARNVWPALSSVKVPMAAMAERAMEMLVQHIRTGSNKETPAVTSTVIGHEIRWRASTGD
ncbi:MAG: LacI family DNA-binding transcriptional regulator [Sphingobium sp.]